MKITKKKVLIGLIVIVVTLISATLILTKNDSLPLQKVEGYNHIEPGEPQCRALLPQCGYCPGKVIDKDCWVWGNEDGKHTKPADACTGKDWEIGNCVPAGRCAPAGESDALIDCATKDYDSKYKTDL